jgi:hypothetical protein
MNTNRFESPKTHPAKRLNKAGSAGPAWWVLAVGSTCFFVVAIWLLTHSV